MSTLDDLWTVTEDTDDHPGLYYLTAPTNNPTAPLPDGLYLHPAQPPLDGRTRYPFPYRSTPQALADTLNGVIPTDQEERPA